MKKFENLGRKLSKTEQKKIKGGFVSPPNLCPGIITCTADYEGKKCPDIDERSTDCTCRKTKDGSYMCNP
ncbi:MAG: hypothetical protein JST10_00805 [Bacteroidetes bacterium]|nr:hypothetical protein [Bacteroidota bacterium]MBS1631089.1 hypothetical protein [Bacteroidota bacterium]